MSTRAHAGRPDDERTRELWSLHLGLLGGEAGVDDGDEEGLPLGLAPAEGELPDDAETIELDLGDLVIDFNDVDPDDDPDVDPGDSGWSRDDHSQTDPEWSDSLTDRDDRVADYSGDAPSREVRSYLQETGTARHIRQALENIGTEEHDMTDEEGAVLDMRNVTRHLAGDTEVRDLYRRRATRPGDDVAVGVSLDMSGSMSSDELDAKAAVGAFLFAVQQLGGDVVANAWQAPGREAKVRLLTGPYERFRWEHLDTVSPGGMDPIAAGMSECAAMLDRSRAREKLLLVVTDGKPTVRSRQELDAENAVDEARLTATELRKRGMTVVGFGFGGVREENMAEMFGNDGYRHVDIDGLADALVECYEDQHTGTR